MLMALSTPDTLYSIISLLANWKNHTPPYSVNPQAMINLLESIFQTHQPTWDDY
jgi:hypothetical protein